MGVYACCCSIYECGFLFRVCSEHLRTEYKRIPKFYYTHKTNAQTDVERRRSKERERKKEKKRSGRNITMPYAQLVIGPAGSGKSTYCQTIFQHCSALGQRRHCINLDPAADQFNYPVTADVQDLITVDDVMEELDLGPNGALMYCMEYLEDNMDDWLAEALEGFGEDDCVIFDCPGQIELYSHHTCFKSFVNKLRDWGWQTVAVYVLDATFITDGAKFIAGCLQAQSAMMLLELPHVNVLTKVDLMEDQNVLEPYLWPDHSRLAEELNENMPKEYRKLNTMIAQLMDDYSLIAFAKLDISDEESVAEVLYRVDNAIQFGEDADVKTSRDLELGDEQSGELPEGYFD